MAIVRKFSQDQRRSNDFVLPRGSWIWEEYVGISFRVFLKAPAGLDDYDFRIKIMVGGRKVVRDRAGDEIVGRVRQKIVEHLDRFLKEKAGEKELRVFQAFVGQQAGFDPDEFRVQPGITQGWYSIYPKNDFRMTANPIFRVDMKRKIVYGGQYEEISDPTVISRLLGLVLDWVGSEQD